MGHAQNSRRPTRYFIEYEDPAKVRAFEREHGPIQDASDIVDNCLTQLNSSKLATAQRIADVTAERHDTLAIVYERINVHRIERGVDRWDWDDNVIVYEANGRAKVEAAS